MRTIDVAMCIASALLVMQLAGCGEEGPATVGELVTFDTVCDKANESKRVALEGYLDFPNEFKSKDLSIMMRLRAAPGAKDRVVGASVRLGTSPNNVAVPPKTFSVKDLKLTMNDGKTAGYADKIKVSGKMYYPIVAQDDFKCGLTNTLIESSSGGR